MKKIVFSAFIFFTTSLLQAQDSIKQNNSIIAKDSVSKPSGLNDKIVIKGGKYFYLGTKKINESKLFGILLDSKSKDVVDKINISLNYRDKREIGYLGYLCAIGATIGSIAYLGRVNNSQYIIVGCCIVGVSLASLGGVYSHNYKKYRKEAIDLYNNDSK